MPRRELSAPSPTGLCRAPGRRIEIDCEPASIRKSGRPPSLVPALLPQFIASWSLSNAEAGWLAGMMSAGYMAAVLPLVALTDRMPACTIFLAAEPGRPGHDRTRGSSEPARQ